MMLTVMFNIGIWFILCTKINTRKVNIWTQDLAINRYKRLHCFLTCYKQKRQEYNQSSGTKPNKYGQTNKHSNLRYRSLYSLEIKKW